MCREESGTVMASNRIFIDDCKHWLSETEHPLSSGYDIIYIDPPYDTGSKLSYADKRSDWREWIEERITAACPHLRENGAVFISIDDNHLIDLCLICDRVFGAGNRLAIMITHQSARSNAKHINVVHEYVLAYAKDKKKLPRLLVPRRMTEDASIIARMERIVAAEFEKNGREAAQKALRKEIRKHPEQGVKWTLNYRSVDEDGRIYYPSDLTVPGTPAPLDIPALSLHLDALPNRAWQKKERILELATSGRLVFLNGRPYAKHYLDDAVDSMQSILPFYSRRGFHDLERLGIAGLFDTPKPTAMIELLILAIASSRKKIAVLDFFAGSGTTAQACYQAQAKLGDEYDVSFDLVQCDETIREGTKPYEKAIELGIASDIPSALLCRIDAYRSRHPECSGYDVVRLSSERA